MKIKALAPIIFLLLSAQLSAAQFMIGPMIGGQYSWISFDDKDNKDYYKVKPVAGFHVGGTMSFLVRKRFYLHSSILYATKGKIIEGKEDKLLSNKVTYHYIDMPILYTVDFKARIGKGKEFKYYLGLGPNISYWLGGKGEIYNSDFEENNIEARSYTISFKKSPDDTGVNEMTISEANRLQLGLNIGAGVVFEPFGYQKIMIKLRYELGHSFFSRTANGNFADTYYQDELRSRNQGVWLSMAYLIDLGLEDRKRGKSTIKRRRL